MTAMTLINDDEGVAFYDTQAILKEESESRKQQMKNLIRLLDSMPFSLHGCVAGSSYIALTDGRDFYYHDVDIFLWSKSAVDALVGSLLNMNLGFFLDEKYSRVFNHTLLTGLRPFKGIYSIRIQNTSNPEYPEEINLIHRTRADGGALSSTLQVLESFDFGFLLAGYDLYSKSHIDLRPTMFPDIESDQPFPLAGIRGIKYPQGLISKYNAIRTAQRFVKYWNYGFDMTRIASQLTEGYNIAAAHYWTLNTERDTETAEVYSEFARLLLNEDYEKLENILAASQGEAHDNAIRAIYEGLLDHD